MSFSKALWTSIGAGGRLCPLGSLCLLLFMVAAGSLGVRAASIENTALFSFVQNGESKSVESTTTSVPIKERTPAEITFNAYQSEAGPSVGYSISPPNYTLPDASQALLPAPTLFGTPINLSTNVSLEETDLYRSGSPAFIIVRDLDQNLDASAQETIFVTLEADSTGDIELLRLVESEPDSGEFVGYIQLVLTEPLVKNGQLSVAAGAEITAIYTDTYDTTDTVATAAAVNPAGLVFSSSTGVAVDGALVRLVNAADGSDALVYAEDGITPVSASIYSGTNGVAGSYQFPVVPPGTYQLEVIPPEGYLWSSESTIAELQSLSGAPFELSESSFGAPFTVTASSAFWVDLPIDPETDEAFIVKEANKDTVSIGEFVRYTITVSNPNVTDIGNAEVVDRQPYGFRYEEGSSYLDQEKCEDPQISADGRELRYALGTLAAGESRTVQYVARVSVGCREGDAVNEATLISSSDALSFSATARVFVYDDMRPDATIIGRVAIDPYAPEVEHGETPSSGQTNQWEGVAGVRIYMENGAYVVTDKDGLYHFEGVTPGTHVLQVDTETLPAGLEPEALANTRFAQNGLSQFVEVQEGTLWRADFPLRRLAPPESTIDLVMTTADGTNGLVDMILSGEAAPVDCLKVIVVTPPGTKADLESITLNGAPYSATPTDNMLTFRIPEQGENWEHRIRLQAPVRDAAQTNEYKVMVMYDWGTHRNLRLPLHVHRAALKYPCTTGFNKTLPKPDLSEKDEASVADEVERYTPTWMEQLEPGFGWIEPTPNSRPAKPITHIGLKHDPTENIRLYVNDREVDPIHFESRMLNGAKTVAVSYWRAVRLGEGWNELKAVRFAANGEVVGEAKRSLYFAGPPAAAEYLASSSTLLADGRTIPTVRLRLTDVNGEPAREGLIGTYSVQSPYKPYQHNREMDRAFAALQSDRPTYEIGPDGIAELQLEPTSVSGEVMLQMPLGDLGQEDQEIRAWLEAPLRDWILVGFAEGTAGYNQLSSEMESLPADVDEDLYGEGQVAFFAKGRVKGNYLMTVAYDSNKDTSENSLFQTIDPDTYYTLYGDDTQQGYEAASGEKLYLKIEKKTFYALFGDYETGLTVTELGRYNRSMTGYQSEYQGERAGYNVFASETGQGFQKDEIPGNGTSGLYQLSSSDIVYNSEKIVIETRDRFHSEEVISSTPLTRYEDYNIDYQAGTLYFKKPILSRDSDFNPNVIVVDYEVDSQGAEEWTYGGRAYVKPLESLEVGATAIQEGQPTTTDQLLAADATLKMTQNLELHAEMAGSEVTRDPAEGQQRGEAYQLELQHETVNGTTRTYYRKQTEYFGLRQQSAGESGTEKYGVETTTRVMTNINVKAELYRQDNLVTQAERDVAEAQVSYDLDRTELHAGVLSATDHFEDAASQRSDQLSVGAEYELFKDKVGLHATRDQSIGGRNENTDFPTRTLIGADYALTPNVRLLTDYELTDGESADTQNLRVGVEAEPWTGGRVNSSLGQNFNENGPRTFSNVGLFQTVKLTDKWSVDGSVDMAQTIHDGQQNSVFSEQTPASGATEDFWAVSLGTGYTEQRWSWTQRIEQLWGEQDERLSYVTGIIGQVQPRLSMSLSAAVFNTDGETENEFATDVRHGLAYRPLESDWVVLNRLDFIFDKTETASLSEDSQRIVNQLSANYHPFRDFQASLRFGCKYVVDHIGEDRYTAFSDLYGVEARYDITPKWDVGYNLLALHSWSGHEVDYATGPSIGYNFAKNVWVSLGYNLSGFYDEDFSAANYTTDGPYLKFRIKFDQNSVKDLRSVLKTMVYQ